MRQPVRPLDGKFIRSLTQPDWTEVPGSEATNQIQLPLSRGHEFFRLVQPPAFFVLFFRKFRSTR